MKKLSIIASVLMVAIFGLAAMSWAQEASVFDDVQKIIIRAFTACTPGSSCPADTQTPTYSAYLEVRDSDGELITPDKLVVTPLPAGNPLTAEAAGTYKIHDNDLSSPDFSISFDNFDGITYLICTNESLHVMKFHIVTLLPVAGACGATLNTCTSGTFQDVGDTSTYNYWNCNGANGGTNASCSLAKVNGVCGTTLNTCTPGTLNDIADSDTNYLWNCNGANGGTNASCSLLKPVSSSLSDLIVSSLSAPTGLDNNSPFNLSVTVRNQGTGSAGPFTVTVYVSKSYLPGGTVFLTWDVGGLAAGQSISKTFNTVVTGLATHGNYYFVVNADSGNIITETNETNNVKYRAFTVAR